MNNIRDSIWNKKVPSVISILLMGVCVLSIIWMSKNTITAGTNASGSSVPDNVEISNITDTGFTVSYTTTEKSIGSVNYGTGGQLGSLALDDRDKASGAPTVHYAHYITVSSLSPSSTIYFSIDSAGTTYLNNGSFYTVKTGSAIPLPAGQTPLALTGNVALDGGDSLNEGIVIASSAASQQVASLVKLDGSYSLSLSALRSSDLNSYVSVTPDTVIQMTVENQTGISQVSLLAGQGDPVPVITVSKNYDFTISNSAVSARSVAPATQMLPFPISVNTAKVTTPDISVPLQNEAFKDLQPQFAGKTVPSGQVSIVIRSVTPILATEQSDEYGNWTFRPAVPLIPGVHTITIQSPDVTGIMQTVTRSFTVYASGSQFTAPSGPPVVLTATPTLSVPTSIPPTAMPIPSPSPSPFPSPSPTLIPTPAIVAPTVLLSPAPKLVTGSQAVIYGGAIAVIVIGIGTLLFFSL
jgi:hypothetical protein